MKLLTKSEFLVNKQEYLKMIRDGAIFIYPTDTIYGIGCDATNKKAVARIRKIKERKDTPFSIIAPNRQWIEENCEVFGKGKDYLDKLPGKYTLIFALKQEGCVADNVNPKEKTSIGVRIPNHWIADVAKELDLPIITTSVNKHGESYLTDITKLPTDIRNFVEIGIDEGKLEGQPSQVISLIDGEAEVKR